MFSISNFQQLMKGLPRGTFDKIVKRRNADRCLKKFRSWDHLIVMLYAQLTGTKGLRPLQQSFNCHSSKHYHLGTSELSHSTLADANEKRSDAVFSDVATWLMNQVSGSVRKEGRELMYLLDSTSLTLKGREFDRWTAQNANRFTQGIKLHVLYDAHGEAPVWHDFSAPNVNDVERAWDVPIQADALYVFDKGYTDYNWWNSIDEAKARFVTRFKYNASVNVVTELEVPEAALGVILKDELVTFKNKNPGGKRVNLYFGKTLRRITVARPDKDRPLILATNDLTRSALEIAQQYKERWGIELFFKWVKQHLKIKHFLGRSENAVRIQVLTALISYLLVMLSHQKSGKKCSLWHYFCQVSASLFQRPVVDESVHRRRQEKARLLAEHQGCLFA
jgi:putative transposase